MNKVTGPLPHQFTRDGDGTASGSYRDGVRQDSAVGSVSGLTSPRLSLLFRPGGVRPSRDAGGKGAAALPLCPGVPTRTREGTLHLPRGRPAGRAEGTVRRSQGGDAQRRRWGRWSPTPAARGDSGAPPSSSWPSGKAGPCGPLASTRPRWGNACGHRDTDETNVRRPPQPADPRNTALGPRAHPPPSPLPRKSSDRVSVGPKGASHSEAPLTRLG